MIDLRAVSMALSIAVVLGACSATSTTPSPDSTPSHDLTPAPVAAEGTPTGCVGLGSEDCARAREMAGSVLVATDGEPVYVQVGPFGCAAGDRCPTTIATRPEGDVTIEFPDGQGINVHLVVAPDGTFEATRQPAMGVAVEPTSATGGIGAPLAYTLGHCGIFSGFDIDGSWWDPVGPLGLDSGDLINSTNGTFTTVDADHGTWVSDGGQAVQLQRHTGSRLLPLCM